MSVRTQLEAGKWPEFDDVKAAPQATVASARALWLAVLARRR
jgi:hypothetical protein